MISDVLNNPWRLASCHEQLPVMTNPEPNKEISNFKIKWLHAVVMYTELVRGMLIVAHLVGYKYSKL